MKTLTNKFNLISKKGSNTIKGGNEIIIEDTIGGKTEKEIIITDIIGG